MAKHKYHSPYESEAVIVQSIGRKAIVFGSCEAAGMVATKVGHGHVVFSLHACGLLLTAAEAVRVLHRYLMAGHAA